MEALLLWNLLFQISSDLSPLKIILEIVFWTNLMLDLICTWLEKTRRFYRQVNKISSCFWTASTCVQRSSLGWCSRLTYQGFWTYLYFRIRHSFAHVWTILNKMAAFGVIAHVRTILNKMASFGVNIYCSSESEHGQNTTNITTI